jgi:hypothetical protein
MSNGIILTNREITAITQKSPKEYRLEIYRILKTTYFSPDTKEKDLKKFQKELVDYLKRKDLPRTLTDNEIEYILKDLFPAPATIKIISDDNLRQLKLFLKDKLKQYKVVVNKDTLEKIKQFLLEQYFDSLCPYGESVGANSAVSISQPLTQATLNTFHSSGSSNQQADSLKYLKQLLDIQKPKKDVTTVHFKDKSLTYEDILNLSESLKGISVKDIIISEEIIKDITPEDKNRYENYINIMGIKFNYNNRNFLRIKLNLNKCYKYNIFINDVVRAIEKNSKTNELRQAIKCIASSTYEGIIDIHVDPEFIKFSINKSKNKLPLSGNLEDLSDIFLTIWLPDLFKEIIVKGTKNINHISISDPINLNTTYEESMVYGETALEKYSQKPYSLKLEDSSRLWKINLNKDFLYSEGIKKEQYIDLFESVNIKIIESYEDELIILLPSKLNINYYDDDNNIKPLYSMKEGVLYNERDGKRVEGIGPKKLIEDNLQFIIKDLAQKINLNIEDIDKNKELPIIPPVYRHAYYYYAILEGKNISGQIMNNHMIDSSFTYPDNVHNVYDILGIEAARFFLVSKYNKSKIVTDGNYPSNVEILIDFQTTLGKLLPASYTGVNRTGSSILSEIGFQQGFDVIKNNSAFGGKDDLKSITASIMTGKICRNGTGFTKVEFDKEYLSNPDNLIDIKDKGKNIPLETDFLVGPCYKTAPEDLNIDFNRENIEEDINFDLPLERGNKESELCLKEEIPEPPRMEPPEFLRSLQEQEYIDIQLPSETTEQELDVEIPDDPGNLESDYF